VGDGLVLVEHVLHQVQAPRRVRIWSA
jgi:hypothetical protein